jgi:MFS transporter, DHA1 family, inner membrane transport protein
MMALFTAGHALTALLSDLWAVLATRFLTALQHGSYFGAAAVVAAEIVHPSKRAQAVSVVFAGLTIANIVGVPVSSLLTEVLGWRISFWCLSVLGLICILCLAVSIPSELRSKHVSLKNEIKVFRRRQIWLALTATGLGYGGVFAAYSYIVPTLTSITNVGSHAVAVVLCLFGVGMTVGNYLGGRAADTNRQVTLVTSLILLISFLFILTFSVRNFPVTAFVIFMIGTTSSSMVPSLQTWVMDEGGNAPVLASASIHSAFNIGNALGAFLGGVVISCKVGYQFLGLLGSIMAFGALVCVLAARRKPVQSIYSQSAMYEKIN